MRFLKALLPNVSIAFCVALLVLTILNEYNPRLGLLQGQAATTLIVLCCVFSIASAVVLYASWRAEK